MRSSAPLALLALAASLLSCRKTGSGTPDAGAPPPRSDQFTMADLAAAAEVDARVARLSYLASQYKMVLTFDKGERLKKRTDQLAPLLDEAAAKAEEAFDRVKNPRDRQKAAPVVEGARRWPKLLRDARTELLGEPNVAQASAAAALGATDDDVSRALLAYRKFRSSWTLADAPSEELPVLEFLEARRTLEAAEGRIGEAFPGNGGPPAGRDGGRSGLDQERKSVEQLVSKARTAAEQVEPERRGAALRWVKAQGEAIDALLKLAAASETPEEQGRLSLVYQVAKVEALTATAEYTAATARRAGPAR